MRWWGGRGGEGRLDDSIFPGEVNGRRLDLLAYR